MGQQHSAFLQFSELILTFEKVQKELKEEHNSKLSEFQAFYSFTA